MQAQLSGAGAHTTSHSQRVGSLFADVSMDMDFEIGKLSEYTPGLSLLTEVIKMIFPD